MTTETSVTIKYDSASLFSALVQQVGEWKLSDHEFDPDTDEIRVSHDSGGSGRIAITVNFEFDRAGLDAILRTARTAE
jgi:hypothetical protein